MWMMQELRLKKMQEQWLSHGCRSCSRCWFQRRLVENKNKVTHSQSHTHTCKDDFSCVDRRIRARVQDVGVGESVLGIADPCAEMKRPPVTHHSSGWLLDPSVSTHKSAS